MTRLHPFRHRRVSEFVRGLPQAGVAATVELARLTHERDRLNREIETLSRSRDEAFARLRRVQIRLDGVQNALGETDADADAEADAADRISHRDAFSAFN
ncbi:MAG: hypothetical protein AAGM38_08360 [Pseudomonadota bacterium]